MNCKMMESYLDNIEEMVVEEDKIVTYKSLSRSLKIHVNTAKQLLYTYLTKEKPENSFPISATYLLAGKLVDGNFNIALVNEDDLKSTSSNFAEITSEHVYSVQKGKKVKDVKVLCGYDKESLKLESHNLVIKCSKSVLKPKERKIISDSCEVQNKKTIMQPSVSEKQRIGEADSNNKTKDAGSETTSKRLEKTSSKGNAEKVQANIRKPTGNIANLFAKAAQKKAEKSLADLKIDKDPFKDELNEITEVDFKVMDRTKDVKFNNTEKISERSELKDSLKSKKKGNKRKRIHVLIDSEESDCSDGAEKKEEPPVLEEQKKKIQEIPQNKRKKRKVINKTVVSEDGYLETKKEVVFKTDSENEAEELISATKEQKSNSEATSDKRKAAWVASTAKKQSSLFTFFKKA